MTYDSYLEIDGDAIQKLQEQGFTVEDIYSFEGKKYAEIEIRIDYDACPNEPDVGIQAHIEVNTVTALCKGCKVDITNEKYVDIGELEYLCGEALYDEAQDYAGRYEDD